LLEKLKPTADGPFKVLQRIEDNAYKIKLPNEHAILAMFSVADVSPYHKDEDNKDSGRSLCTSKAFDARAFLEARFCKRVFDFIVID